MKRTALDIDDNRSVWSASAPPTEALPALEKNILADVAIIGGGFTGISTAYHLAKRFPEKRIVVLEAKTLANGASGRNGGMMLNWINGVDYSTPEVTTAVYKATLEGIELIEGLIKEHNMAVPYRRDGCMQVQTNEARSEEAHKYAEKYKSWGLPIEFLSGDALRAKLRMEKATGAIFDPTEGELHGLCFVRELARVTRGMGVDVYENTPVLAIEEGESIRLVTPKGEVKARAIVLGTNGYTPRLGYYKRGILPLHSHVLATRPLTPEEREELGWGAFSGFSDDYDRISYASMTPHGELLFGGGSNAAYSYLYGGRSQYPGSPESAPKAFAAMEQRLREYFPKIAQVEIKHRWTGTLGITMSRQCSIGVMGEYKNIYFGLGYSGHGVTLANLAGKVICDIYSGADERWRGLPFYQKTLHGIPPDPFCWVGYHVYTALTGRSPRKNG